VEHRISVASAIWHQNPQDHIREERCKLILRATGLKRCFHAMAAGLSINGITMPNDFPTTQFEAVYKKLGSKYGGRFEYDVLTFQALNAIAYRFHALAEYDQSYTVSFNAHGADTAQPFRYEQERDLFGFFSNAFSVFEALCFALFAVGTLIEPANFPLATDTDERNVRWKTLQQAYCKAFRGDPILSVLQTIANDPEFKDLGKSRHILAHRAVASRALSGTTGPPALPDRMSRLKISLDAGTTGRPRSQAARLLRLGFEAMQKFVEARM
jgi:hypothetical protein